MTHTLKTWPEYYKAIHDELKTFELRKDDRPYAIGDVLILQEWNPETGQFTGKEIKRTVTYVLRDAVQFGLYAGFVILGIKTT